MIDITNSISIGSSTSGISWSSYWTKLLSDIEYSHPMLPGLTIDKVNGVWTITSHTIDDFRKSLPTPTVKYVDAVNGLDTNNGNTAGTAYKTFTKLNTVTYDRAYITAGNYAATASALVFGDREIIADANANVCRGYLGTECVWTDAGGGVFTTPATAILVVVDTAMVDAKGDITALKLVADETAVAATAGTFYRKAATNTLYVRMYDDQTPNRDTVMVAIATMGVDNGKYNYVENLTLIGGTSVRPNNVFAAKGCKFIYRINGNGYSSSEGSKSWLEDCVSCRHRDDAFSIKGTAVIASAGVEIRCIGRDCGGADNYGTLSSINNGSTSHFIDRIIRLYGEYYNTEGRLVHDVNNAVSLNIACNAHDSAAVTAGTKSAYASGVAAGDTSKVYLFECISSGMDTSGAENVVPATAHIYAHGGTIHSVAPGTTLETF